MYGFFSKFKQKCQKIHSPKLLRCFGNLGRNSIPFECSSSTFTCYHQMDENEGKVFLGSVCCFGVSYVGVAVSVVLAEMCPSVNFTVVDLDPDRIMLWNTKQLPIREPGLAEMLKKCQNRNLVFTTNAVKAIKYSDIIFISFNSVKNFYWSQDEKTASLKYFEKAAKLIAQVSENNKIIVLKDAVSLGSSEIIKRILLENSLENVKFQVLTIPEFFSRSTAVSSLLYPERVLIGYDLSAEALKATETLISIYSPWVPRNKIVAMGNRSVELTRLSHNAFLAQRLSNLSALSIICEEIGGDITNVAQIVGKSSEIGPKYLEPSFGFGGINLKNDLIYLKYVCESLNLFEMADYWNQVILMNEFQKKRFLKKILFSFFNTLSHKKLAIWGLEFKKGAETTENSVAIELCLSLLDEGAELVLYEPQMEKRQLMDELRAVGVMDRPNEVMLCDDPYKAAHKVNGIIVCTDWDEFKDLNYNIIYKNMLKPAYIFDGRKCLPHEELIKIGFIVQTIGRKFKQNANFLQSVKTFL